MIVATVLAAALGVAPASTVAAEGASVSRAAPWKNPYGRCPKVGLVAAKAPKAPVKPEPVRKRKPWGQYAVIRTVDGCGVSTPMR